MFCFAIEAFDIGSESSEKTLNPLPHNASEELLLGQSGGSFLLNSQANANSVMFVHLFPLGV